MRRIREKGGGRDEEENLPNIGKTTFLCLVAKKKERVTSISCKELTKDATMAV